MKILVTGGCGFIGASLCIYLNEKGFNVYSLDNLSKLGSEYNKLLLLKKKIKNFKIDIKSYNKIVKLPRFDIIIDCCAEAAVEISKKDIDRVINTNLIGTINILKKAKINNSKIIFLSSSRVYSIEEINKLIYNRKKITKPLKISQKINEKFNTNKPKSIYGLTKLASEMFIQEFSYAFGIKYLINRCGVISGPLQIGKVDQGFLSLWIWRHLTKKKLTYIGYGGHGNQVRDVLHVTDLCELIEKQIKNINKKYNLTFTVGGSKKSFVSLKNLTKICEKITNNKIKISKKPKTSIYDIPYYISDNTQISKTYNWSPKRNINNIVLDTFNWLNSNKSKLNKFF